MKNTLMLIIRRHWYKKYLSEEVYPPRVTVSFFVGFAHFLLLSALSRVIFACYCLTCQSREDLSRYILKIFHFASFIVQVCIPKADVGHFCSKFECCVTNKPLPTADWFPWIPMVDCNQSPSQAHFADHTSLLYPNRRIWRELCARGLPSHRNSLNNVRVSSRLPRHRQNNELCSACRRAGWKVRGAFGTRKLVISSWCCSAEAPPPHHVSPIWCWLRRQSGWLDDWG